MQNFNHRMHHQTIMIYKVRRRTLQYLDSRAIDWPLQCDRKTNSKRRIALGFPPLREGRVVRK